MDIDATKLDDFMGRFVQDLGAVMHAATIVVGDRLGLYKALARDGAQTPSELAIRTETDPRYVREWLCAQAASGYVNYDAPREREVLQWVAAGKTDRDIALIVGSSVRTVHKHLQHIYAKLGVETRTAAAMRALA